MITGTKPKFKMLWQTMAVPVPVAVCTSIVASLARGREWPQALGAALIALSAVMVAVFFASLIIYAINLKRSRNGLGDFL